MTDTSIRGRFVWHKLMTDDAASAAAFYSKIAGWKPQPCVEQPSYTLLVAGKSPMAGVMPRPRRTDSLVRRGVPVRFREVTAAWACGDR